MTLEEEELRLTASSFGEKMVFTTGFAGPVEAVAEFMTVLGGGIIGGAPTAGAVGAGSGTEKGLAVPGADGAAMPPTLGGGPAADREIAGGGGGML